MPVRIQRKRTKGFRLQDASPNGLPVVYVGRPSKWGNPYTGATALDDFTKWASNKRLRGDLHELRGKNLACWCKLCERHRDGKPLGVECSDCVPCHAEILLEISNASKT